jgi:hypothetical protein
MSTISGYGGGGDIAEIQARMEQQRAQRFAQADADGSGALSFEEMDSAISGSPLAGMMPANGKTSADVFASMDSDGDGKVTEAEMSAAGPLGGGALSSDMMSVLVSLQGGGAQGLGAGGFSFDPMALFGGEDNEGGVEQDPLSEFLDALGESDEDAEDREKDPTL